MMIRLVKYLIPLMACAYSCTCSTKQEIPEQNESEVARIMKSGTLRVVLDYNSTNYFIYRGRPMGFEYEILNHLANDMRVKLEITVRNNDETLFQDLYDKKYDLLAKNLTISKNKDELIEYTYPLIQPSQVLVQRKPEKWRTMNSDSVEKALIRNQLDLEGKIIYVPKGSSQEIRLNNLSEEIGADIKIVTDSIDDIEYLIEMVSKGEIDYTVCHENIASANKRYYPDIDVETPVSFPQNQAWAVRADSPEWLDYLNNWLSNFKKTSTFSILYDKYFISSKTSSRFNSNYHSYTGGLLSPYDDLIKQLAQEANIDWLLVAAIICQESGFDPEAQSWRGAGGLMQIMPESAETFGTEDYLEPANNIRTGIKLLQWLDGRFKTEIPDSTERIKFVLASYNAGIGHVHDAQRLAVKYDKSPVIWEQNVDYFILNKSLSKYYKDTVVKFGYCRGTEPFQYVTKVLDIYHHYHNVMNYRVANERLREQFLQVKLKIKS